MGLKATIRFRVSKKLAARANRVVRVERARRQRFCISDFGREAFAETIAAREKALGIEQNGKAVAA